MTVLLWCTFEQDVNRIFPIYAGATNQAQKGCNTKSREIPQLQYAKDRGREGVNPGFEKIETKDSKCGRDVLFGGLNFIREVQKIKHFLQLSNSLLMIRQFLSNIDLTSYNSGLSGTSDLRQNGEGGEYGYLQSGFPGTLCGIPKCTVHLCM